MSTYRCVALALGAAIALSACSKSDVDNTQNAIASAVPASVKSALPGLEADARIIASTEGHLVQIDPSSAVHVIVTSKAGAVALSGSVRTDDTQKSFVAAAKGVSGVKSVTSTIAVDPTLPNASEDVKDFTLEAHVRAKLVSAAGLGGVHVRVKARNGAITLAGTVASQDVSTTLEQASKSVKGVTTVTNQLTVK